MQVLKSRHTPGAMGYEIKLNIGETVKYGLKTGKIENIIINSELMSHSECVANGYEAIFEDGEIYFADGERIIWWDGKCDK